MKQTVRKSVVLGTFGLALVAASSGCSDDPTGGFSGFGNNGNATAGQTNTSGGSSSAGTFSSTAGMTSTSGGSTPVAGSSFSTSGAPATAGAPSTAGAGGSAAGSGGAGGAGTAGAGTAGTSGGGNCPAAAGVHTGTAFTRTCFAITASHCANTADNKDPPANALDGDAAKRWSTGGAMDTDGKYTFTVNLGSAVMVSGVVGTTVNGDAPPTIEVSTSTDGNAFTPVACATVTGDIDVGFTAVNAQYVRLTQKGLKTPNWWSIHELNVYGTGTTCGGGGTGTHTCTVSVM